MQQNHRGTVAQRPVNDFGVAALDAMGGDALHVAIKTQVRLPVAGSRLPV
jgi:hypothetical protein